MGAGVHLFNNWMGAHGWVPAAGDYGWVPVFTYSKYGWVPAAGDGGK
jgi:hypothetical protein